MVKYLEKIIWRTAFVLLFCLFALLALPLYILIGREDLWRLFDWIENIGED